MSLTAGGSFNDKVNFIWSVADLLRGDYRQSEYGKVNLPMTVIRRLDSVLADTKDAVIARHHELTERIVDLGRRPEDAQLRSRLTVLEAHMQRIHRRAR